ncbi:MAG: DRTGG domain-containing protein [Hydrogenoanaerobacterium sp.]
MTVEQIAKKCNFEILCGGAGLSREVTDVFCCDLLSWAMGRAPTDGAWVTVMGNLNAVAVAVLADCACIVLAENANADEAASAKATAEGVAVLRTSLSEFKAGLVIYDAIK